MLKIKNHALIEHHLKIIRDKNTKREQFQNSISQICTLMLAEVLGSSALKKTRIDTPVVKNFEVQELNEDFIFVPILRAGLGMVAAVQNLIPESRIGHIGMFRAEETKEAHAYLYRMPQARANTHVIVLDPIMETGNSATSAIQQLKDNGYQNITFIGIIGVQEGVDQLETKFGKDFPIYLSKLDLIHNIGDAGDRTFGTLED